MYEGNNVNDNEKPKVLRNNDNVNVMGKYDRSKKVDEVADNIIRKLGVSPAYRAFYCKVAWKLSEARVYANLEAALRGKQPAKLFTYLCKRDMA